MRPLALSALLLAVAAACGERAGAVVPTPLAADDEDAEVAAYFKGKGWLLLHDRRISDGRPIVFLFVEDRKKLFTAITLTPDDYKMIARSKTVQVLDIRWVKATDAGLKAIAAMPRLESLFVKSDDVTDAGLKALAGCKSLESVSVLSAEKVTDAGVKALAALPKLQALHLSFVALDGSALAAFAGSKTLTSLSLEYVDGLTDAAAKHIAKLPALDELKIGNGFTKQNVSAAGIKVIVDARLPAKFEFDKSLIDDDLFASLVAKGWLYGPTPPGATEKRPAAARDVRTINLDGSRVTDKGFAAVLDCTNATHLFLSRTGVTDVTFKELAGFTKLEYLSLDTTKVTAAGLEAVAGLPIKHVGMDHCELTEDAFKAFGKMAALEDLWLRGAKMKGEWLKHIAALPKLQHLSLVRTDFDDAAVKHLTSLPSLKSLTLNDTNLTDVGFRELLKRPHPRSLSLDGTKVTKEAYLKAKKDDPKRNLHFYAHDQ